MTEKTGDNSGDYESPPPFFRKWKHMYLFVLAVFALLVILFYIFTISFA